MSSQIVAYRWRRADIFVSLVICGGFIYIFLIVSSTYSGARQGKNVEEGGLEIRNVVYESLQCRQALAEKESRLHAQSLNKEKTFLDVAKETKTSKVTDVKYQCMYEDALAPYRHVKGLKILEIGLGGGMPSGPGLSYTLWTKYFLDPKITFMEYAIDCGEIWFSELRRNATKSGDISKLPTMFYGDMREKEDLRRMAEEHGPWDIIIDDGWHEPFCQIPALRSLLKHVNPGGTYFIEDLFMWGKKPENGTLIQISRLMALSIAQKYGKHLDQGLFQDLASDWDTPGIGELINRVSYCDAMCAIRLNYKF